VRGERIKQEYEKTEKEGVAPDIRIVWSIEDMVAAVCGMVKGEIVVIILLCTLCMVCVL